MPPLKTVSIVTDVGIHFQCNRDNMGVTLVRLVELGGNVRLESLTYMDSAETTSLRPIFL